jgi:hypothetical protein
LKFKVAFLEISKLEMAKFTEIGATVGANSKTLEPVIQPRTVSLAPNLLLQNKNKPWYEY